MSVPGYVGGHRGGRYSLSVHGTWRPHDLVGGRTVRTRPGLGRVREGQTGRVDDAVVAYERDRHLRRLAYPEPLAAEQRDVRHDAKHALLTSVHGLGLHVAEPDLQVRREIVARQLEHRHVAAAVEVQAVDQRYRRHRRPYRAHTLEELVLRLVGADDRPAGAVVDHLLVRFLRARRSLELYNALLRQAQVHMIRVLHVKGALVQLRYRIVGLQTGHLFVHLANHQPRQSHSCNGAHQFHGATVVHVTVAHLKLLRLALVIVQEVDGERAPLRRTRVEIAVLHVKIARADCLRSQSIEKCHLRAAGDAQVCVLQGLLLLGRLRDHLDTLALKHADVVAAAVEHFHREHKVLALVRVGDVESLCRAVLLAVVQIQLLHILIRIADADESAQLGTLLALALAQHLLLTHPPAVAEEVDARWWAEKPFLVAV